MKTLNNYIIEKGAAPAPYKGKTVPFKSGIIDINDIKQLKNASVDDIMKSIFPVDKFKQIWADAKVHTDNWVCYDQIEAYITVYFNEHLKFECSWCGKTALRIDYCKITIDEKDLEIPSKYKKLFNFGERCFSLLEKIDDIKTELTSKEQINGPISHSWTYRI